MKIKKYISALLSSAILLGTGNTVCASAVSEEKYTPSGLAYSEIGSSIDSFIKEREAGLASCAVSVFDSDGVIYNGYYGYSDIENNIPADAETVYEWGSSSKMIVWTCVMQQWERGNIDFDTDIREYLPNNFLTKLQYPDEKITMLDLMNHKAGFQESFYENQECGEDGLFDSLEDAVKFCECYQAYHVGEHTSYSNWGTALAAYIVEHVSGTDYVTYVNENIFEPLEMEHSSIDPRQTDNNWVKEKRDELKCYSRYADEKYNEDYGTAKVYVQLFPVGACISTLEDMSKFGQALATENSPLFDNPETYEEMFSATSYYGDTDIAKVCHGFWTQQYLVETIGHGGNTMGCTANLEIDPVSSLGVVILTNEAGETAFCNGIPTILYGHMYDRPECKNYSESDSDLSGMYYCKRSFTKGAGKAMQYVGGVMPIKKTDGGKYTVNLFGMSFGEQEYIPVGNDLYLVIDNGSEMLVHAKDGLYEMPYMDYVRSDIGSLPTIICYGFIIFSLLCLIVFLIKIIFIIKNKNKSIAFSDKQILVQQIVYGVSGIIFSMTMFLAISNTPALTAISGILAGLLGVFSLVNGSVLCYNTIKGNTNALIKINQSVWAVLCVAYSIFIAVMQLYCFWKL